jgi:hypothetical protein
VGSGGGGRSGEGEGRRDLLPSAGSGGSAGRGGTGLGNLGGGPGIPDAGGACADDDADGVCNAADRCPLIADQDDSRDRDRDGVPDACDQCGIGDALELAPLFYFPLDDGPLEVSAENLGSVPQEGIYTGPVTRGLRGVADPDGRAARFEGSLDGAFSRLTVLDVSEFPVASLTALFWLRTTRADAYAVISYAVEGSANEFEILFEGDSARLTLNSAVFLGDVGAGSLSDGGWHFVAFTWDGSSAQFYFDGQAAGSPIPTLQGFEATIPGAVPVTGPLRLRPGGALVLGQDQDAVNGGFSTTQMFVGGIDEVALYDRVLTEPQIQRVLSATTCGEVCNGQDDDRDGLTDEGFLGTRPECPAASCAAIQAAGEAFGSGAYFISATTAAACAF